MAQIEFVLPQKVTNWFDNPRCGTGDTTGFTLIGSAISSVITRARWGMYSIQTITNGAGAYEGVYATVNFAAPGTTTAQFFTGSVYVRGAGTVRVRLNDITHALNFVSREIILNDERWQRIGISGFIPAGCLVLRLYVETTFLQAVTFYVDGIQPEDYHEMTSYVDGDRENEIPPHDGDVYYKWTGTIHGSPSVRAAHCKIGGRTVKIENKETQLFITDSSGLGMPDIDIHLSEYATVDGAEVEGYKVLPRVIQLLFTARRFKNSRICTPASLHELHRERQKLEDILKPDKAPFMQPVLMRYQDGKDSKKVEIFVTYEGGLGWDGDLRDPAFNEFMVRLIAGDPYWYEDTQDVHAPTGYQLLITTNRILARIDGEWQMVGSADNPVFKIAVHPNGDVYAGGSFGAMSGVANTAYVARYDGTQWHSLGGAGNALNNEVRAVDFLPDGRVLLGGGFTQYGVVACNYVVLYDPVADTYSTMGAGPGFNGKAYDFAVNDAGKAYVVGLFTQDSGAAVNYNYIALYDPPSNTFSQVGAGPGLNNNADCASMDNDGEIVYIGGIFTSWTGGPANALDCVTYYDPNDNSFNAMGTGCVGVVWVYDMLCTHDNRVYAVGQFTHIGYMDVGYIGVWNGGEWYPLGNEGDGFALNGGTTIRCLHENYKNLLFIGGDQVNATGSALSRALSSWNRSRFQHWDVIVPDQDRIYTIASKNDDLWIGFNGTGTGKASEVFTVDNIGKTVTYPVLEILGPCHIEWLENQTAGLIVRLDLAIREGERVYFDFHPLRKAVRSTFRKHADKGILSEGDNFYLMPGENRLALFCEDVDPYTHGTEISMRWPIVNWSFDDLR